MSMDEFCIPSEGETCAVCGKSIRKDCGYAHVKYEGEMIPLCSPLCVETFQKQPHVYTSRKQVQNLIKPGGGGGPAM